MKINKIRNSTMSADSSNMIISSTRYINIDNNLKKKLKGIASLKDINKSTNVISIIGMNTGNNVNFLAYNKPYSAFVINKLPLKLCIRGTVYNLSKDNIIYIPPNKKAIIYKNMRLIAAIFLFLMISMYCIYPSIHRSLVLPNMEVSQLFNNGYMTIEDLPASITSKVPELTDKLLFADNSTSYINLVLLDKSEDIKHLIYDLGLTLKEDYKLISFFHHIVINKTLTDSVRKYALLKQLELAKSLDLIQVLLYYKAHTDFNISNLTKTFMKLNDLGE